MSEPDSVARFRDNLQGEVDSAALYRATLSVHQARNGALEWRRAASSPGLANFPKPPSFRQLEDARLKTLAAAVGFVSLPNLFGARAREKRGLRPLPRVSRNTIGNAGGFRGFLRDRPAYLSECDRASR